MKSLGIQSILNRLSVSRGAEKAAEKLAGDQAREELLLSAGYAKNPEGLASRLALEVPRALGLVLDPKARQAYGRHFEGGKVMAAARREAELRLPPAQTRPAPSSRTRLRPEEARALWPWLSGQRPVRLARAHALTQDQDLGIAAVRSLENFCQQNPPLMGPGWADNQILAARAVNWLWALAFMGDLQGVDPGVILSVCLQFRVMGLVWEHEVAPDKGRPGPMQAAPAAALFHLASALPFLPESETWREKAMAALGPALAGFGRQGGPVDCAQAALACELAGLVQALAARHGAEISGLFKGLRDLAWLCRCLAPPWGAGKGWGAGPAGPALDFTPGTVDAYTGAANLAAMVLADPELRAGRVLDERLYWLFGPQAGEQLRRLAAGGPPQAGESTAVGIAALCAKWRKRRLGVFMRTAPGRTRAAAVEQAPALSLLLCLDGKPLMDLPGPAGTGPMAPHLASRLAQNALVVDGQEPKMGRVEMESLEMNARQGFISATYSGYAHLADPVTLRRRVYLDLEAGLINVVDQIQAEKAHDCQVLFHLPPGSQVEADGSGGLILSGPFGLVRLRPEPQARARVVEGQSDPPLGWALDETGQVRPAPVVVIQARTMGSTRLTNVIALMD